MKFTALNDAYRARFGFPFIMAVKGKSKADILAGFERRLANDADIETEDRACRGRPHCGAAAQGHSVLSVNTRVIRGRILTFRTTRRRPGRLRMSISRTGRSWSRMDLLRRLGRRAKYLQARRRRDDRRSFQLPCHAWLHRRTHPLSANQGHRLLWRATPRLAAQLYLRRGAEVCRPRPLRAGSPNSFSTSFSAAERRRRWSIARCIRNRSTLSSRRQSERGARMIAGKTMMDRDAPDGPDGHAQRGYDESKALIGTMVQPRPTRLCDHAAVRGDVEPGAIGGGRRAGPRDFLRLMSRRISTRTRPRSSSSPSAFRRRGVISTCMLARGCSDRDLCSVIAST